jgi:hypothetical protein
MSAVEETVDFLGISSRMPYRDYAALRGISITRLKELKRSPKHYKHRLSNPKETPSLKLGTAAHTAVLEPERFGRDYAVWAERTKSGNMRPRNGKFWDAFAAQHKGQTILTAHEYEDAMAIQAAVRGDPTAMRYLQSGDPEVSMQWPLDGQLCKGRLDWLTTIDGEPALVGLKTSRDCRHFIFGSAAAKLGYHLQWAYYFDGYTTIKGDGVVPRVVEIVVESDAPYAVAVYQIPFDIIEQGREEYEDLLAQLAECEANNDWPGPVTEEQILTLPSWVYQTQDDLSDLGLEM